MNMLLVLTSCDHFAPKKISSEEILSEERRELNWHEVDQYPAFETCREYIGAAAARRCFEEKVTTYFYKHLESQQPVVTAAINDTLYLYLSISEKGIPAIDSTQIDAELVEQLPEIENWLYESVAALPKIFPATKRGIPVVSSFKMPIVIQAE